jgi:opacity protein-like surface antigen
VKVRGVPKAVPEAVVAATKHLRWLATLTILFGGAAHAAVLPDDRADAMYHSYDGGGLEVNGPSYLVRKGFKDKVSAWSNYYVDSITSASIDVVTTASPYNEQRDEVSAGVDYLHGKTLMGLSYTNSEESDYTANAVRFGISQDFFGDLTTLGISYARGWDTVRNNSDPTFEEDTDRQSYRIDLSQIITRNMIMSLNYEGITDEGFLNNPYRSVRYEDPSSPVGFSYQPEVYPRTKTSSAVAVRGRYFLPYRAAVNGEVRYYTDTWDVDAYNIEVGYTHPLWERWVIELRYRYYDQTAAEFYSDLFPRQDYQNFLARDKELSTFSSHTIGAGVTYQFGTSLLPFFKRGEASLFADYLKFDYDDFRDVRDSSVAVGAEPLYEFNSTVLRAYISLWY